MPDSCGHGLLLEMSERNEVLSIPQEALKQKLWVTGSLSSVRGIRVKIPAASGGALEGRSLSCWGNLSPKPPNKDAIPPHRKQWGILASFREEFEDRVPYWKQHGLIIKYLPPYSPELNLIEILWRRIKYDWLPFSAYACLNAMIEALDDILSHVGSKYQITFA